MMILFFNIDYYCFYCLRPLPDDLVAFPEAAVFFSSLHSGSRTGMSASLLLNKPLHKPGMAGVDLTAIGRPHLGPMGNIPVDISGFT